MRYFMSFSYDGSKYIGYQKQREENTVQKELEDNLKKINSNKDVKVVAAGRTDRGVHAICQCAHFDLDKNIDPNKLKNSLNKLLKTSIYVYNLRQVDHNFHARFNACGKKYVYKINLGKYNPIQYDYIYQYCNPLDIEKMKIASSYLIGTHDYTSFIKATDLKEDNIRTIEKIDFIKEDDVLNIEFVGNGFLRYMVRNMVGTLITVGSNEINPLEVKRILEFCDRTKAFITAPPQGLYLTEINYNHNFN